MKTIRALNETDISGLIEDPEIETVSFDFFDTLFLRPCVCPKDIFCLPDDLTERKFGLSFSKLRLRAEEELGEENATLEDIWRHIADKNNISDDIREELTRTELELESRLLQPKRDTERLYRKAVSEGKKVWIVSDMYLPSEFLRKLLTEAGLPQADKIFVSCEHKKRKATGELYDMILREEKVEDPSTWLHIGDNFESDYKMPLSKGILSVYYPSVWDSVINSETPWGMLFPEQCFSDDPMMRILFGYALARAWNAGVFDRASDRFFNTVGDFASLFLAPLLTAIAADLLNNPEMKEYHVIRFAARDGYLPKTVYGILSNDHPAAEARYLYASRIALGFAEYADYFDFFEHIQENSAELSLGGLIGNTVTDENIKNSILEDLTPDERELALFSEHKKVLAVLSRYREKLNAYFSGQRALSRKYYQKEFEDESGRQIVFDCGYSGSVSRGLANALDNRLAFDKYYLWEMQSNQRYDRVNGTKTICFFKADLAFFNIILEECFSPSEGSCIGFCEKGDMIRPVSAKETFSVLMEKDLEQIRKTCCDFADEFRQSIGYYLSGFRVKDTDLFTKIARAAFVRSPYCEAEIFDRIVFTDLFQPERRSLAAKTYRAAERCGEYVSPIEGTGIRNPENVLYLSCDAENLRPGKTGIHLHLYHACLCEEILWYLREFPFKYDLFITVTDPGVAAAVKKVFSVLLGGSLDSLDVTVVPNMGRDVGPWIVGIGDRQKTYDLFCHIHTKESSQYGGTHGTEWRRYLYDNLITPGAAKEIMTLFSRDEKLGCVFPKPFQPQAEMHIKNGIPLCGKDGEEQIINKLLKRMGIEDTIERNDLLFSVGTMMWYRPKAFERLFGAGISYEEFGKEPLPAGGTLAHAIERIFSVLAEHHGYHVGMYNANDEEDPEIEKSRRKIAALRADLNKTAMDLQNILNSKSFKAGRIMTFAMRKLRDGNMKIHELVKRFQRADRGSVDGNS